jgi:hypothetical protein
MTPLHCTLTVWVYDVVARRIDVENEAVLLQNNER